MTDPLHARAAEPSQGLKACRILVVEDSEPVRRLIGAYLGQAGLGNVIFAGDGVEGLNAAWSDSFDLVILDIMMPEMDGFEVCRRLRADERTRHLPILVQTGLESREQRLAVFQAGATDLISKPIDGVELLARIRVHLENRLLLRELRAYQDRVGEELAMSRDMQFALLPRPDLLAGIEERHGLDIEAVFEPSFELGGDHWAIKDLGENKIAVAIADFTGHGVRAALNTFRVDILLRPNRPEDASPAAYLDFLNQRLVGVLPVGQYATMLYGVIDFKRDMFLYAAAAAPHPLVVNDDGLLVLDGSGLPLGVSRQARYEERIARFTRGSTLFLFSDVLLETEDADGRCLDHDALIALLEDSRRVGAGKGMLGRVLDRFRFGRKPLGDDLTAIAITRRRPEPPSPRAGDWVI